MCDVQNKFIQHQLSFISCTHISISRCSFIESQSTSYGGALNTGVGIAVGIHYSAFFRCFSSQRGGALYCAGLVNFSSLCCLSCSALGINHAIKTIVGGNFSLVSVVRCPDHAVGGRSPAELYEGDTTLSAFNGSSCYTPGFDTGLRFNPNRGSASFISLVNNTGVFCLNVGCIASSTVSLRKVNILDNNLDYLFLVYAMEVHIHEMIIHSPHTVNFVNPGDEDSISETMKLYDCSFDEFVVVNAADISDGFTVTQMMPHMMDFLNDEICIEHSCPFTHILRRHHCFSVFALFAWMT